MSTLEYSIIKNRKQYDKYSCILEKLVSKEKRKSATIHDELELLTLLIEKWDEEQNSFQELNPVQLRKVLMKENGLQAKNLVEIMGIPKGIVSSILNYRKGLSKENIRKLSAYFSVSQEAFNHPYKIKAPVKSRDNNVGRPLNFQ